MSRELPIHNGRMTTDLDANGFKIKNLPPGSGFMQAQADWSQTDATAPDFIKNKPAIPAAVTVDSTLAVQGAAADAKAAGDALAGKVGCDAVKLRQGFGDDVDALFSDGLLVGSTRYDTHGTLMFAGDGSVFARDTVKVAVDDADPFDVALAIEPQFNVDARGEFSFLSPSISVAPGPFATVGSVPLYLGFLVDGTGKFTPFVADDPSVDDPDDALVVAPGNAPYTSMDFDFTVDGHRVRMWVDESASCVMTLDARVRMFLDIPEGYYAANKADLPYALVPKTPASGAATLSDRAVNAVPVTGATTLTFPALENVGKARDFLVKVTTSVDDVGITWQGQGSEAPNGADELQFVTEDGDFPVVGTAGDYLFSFTEIEPHTFAVSMKPVVAAPQAQGGA